MVEKEYPVLLTQDEMIGLTLLCGKQINLFKQAYEFELLKKNKNEEIVRFCKRVMSDSTSALTKIAIVCNAI